MTTLTKLTINHAGLEFLRFEYRFRYVSSRNSIILSGVGQGRIQKFISGEGGGRFPILFIPSFISFPLPYLPFSSLCPASEWSVKFSYGIWGSAVSFPRSGKHLQPLDTFPLSLIPQKRVCGQLSHFSCIWSPGSVCLVAQLSSYFY